MQEKKFSEMKIRRQKKFYYFVRNLDERRVLFLCKFDILYLTGSFIFFKGAGMIFLQTHGFFTSFIAILMANDRK